jgi:hypothetical protein
MTLDNLQYALYLNNCILLDKIKAIKDAIDGDDGLYVPPADVSVYNDIKEQNRLLKEEIESLKTLLDNINRVVI